MALPKRVALYARFSSDIQNPASVDDQLARLRLALAREGTDPTDALVFSDAAVSGSTWRARPGIQSLLSALKRREISCVYAEAVDRISRDPGDLSEFKKLLHFYGSSFVSVSDGLRLDGSSGSALVYMMRSFTAEQSVKDTADKSQRGLRANVAARKTTGGRTYGYARTKIGESRKGTAIRRNDVDEKQADVVRRIFAMYAQGHGYGSIAAALNADGVPPPQRARTGVGGWISSCIREMLRNQKYAGDWSFGRREWTRHPETERRVVRRRRDPNDSAHPNDRERFVSAQFPELAIIDRPLWDTVQARLADHTLRYQRREVSDRKSFYLLSGLLRCGVCGAPMQIAGGTVPRYRCSANAKRGTCTNSLSVREPELREGVIAGMAEVLSAPATFAFISQRVATFLQKQAEASDARRAGLGDEIAELERQVATAEDRLKKLYLRWADGDADGTLNALIAELRGEVARGRSALDERRAMTTAGRTEAPTATEVSELAEYIVGLSFLNELDQEFEDLEPVHVRVGKSREALRVLLKDGKVTATPHPTEKAVYVVEAVLLPLAALAEKPQKGGKPAYDNSSCAGAICALEHAVLWVSGARTPLLKGRSADAIVAG